MVVGSRKKDQGNKAQLWPWGSYLSLMLEVSYGVQMIRSSNSFAFSWEPDAHARCIGEEQRYSRFLPTPSESIGEPSPVRAQRLTLVTFGLCRTYAGWPPRCSHSAHATPSRRMSSATPCVCGSSSPEKFPSRISSQVGPAITEQLCFPAQVTESWTAPLPTKIVILVGGKRSCVAWQWASHSESGRASLWI